MSITRICLYLLQTVVFLLLVFVLPYGPSRHWIIPAYILLSLFVVRLVAKR
jgi:hypothetical protein